MTDKSWWDISCNMGWNEMPPKWRPIKRFRWLSRQYRIRELEVAVNVITPRHLETLYNSDPNHWSDYTPNGNLVGEFPTITEEEYNKMFER
jgi:hypothetical protein